MNVLLVEDDDGVREVMEDLLRDSAHVRSMSAVAEAITTLQSDTFELVIADLRIRGHSEGGWQILTVARRRLVPIVIMTGLQRDEVRRSLGAFQPEAVLFKPFAIEEATALFGRFALLWRDVELLAANPRSGGWAPLGEGAELLAVEGDLREGRRLLRCGAGARIAPLRLPAAQAGKVVEGELSINGEEVKQGRSFFLAAGQVYDVHSGTGGQAALISAPGLG